MRTHCRFADLAITFGSRLLFHGLDARLDGGFTGLVGPNGRGKSVLLRLLAGELAPAAGRIDWSRRRHFVGQLQRVEGPRVADALGIGALHDLLARIEQGRGTPQDLAAADGCWHLPEHWRAALQEAGLSATLDTSVAALSGGERTRLALCAAFLQSDHYLLLDEPTNHLDAAGRAWFLERLQRHDGGALVATHDRALLRHARTLLELREDALRVYGGGYDLYRSVRDAETEAAERLIETTRRELRDAERQHQAALQRASRRRKQGERLRRSGSQSKLLLDAQAQRAQHTQARLSHVYDRRSQCMKETLRAEQQRREARRAQRLRLTREGLRGGLRLHLRDLLLPWVRHTPLSATIHGGERWRVHGGNGAGKSTLLKVIAGDLRPAGGICRRSGTCLRLDQELVLFDDSSCAIDNLVRLHPRIARGEWRTRLGSVRLQGDKALLPVRALSGGERLKVALLAMTGAARAPDLLLLDEPDNHLDLDSRELLEETLQDYPGTLIVVSHDEVFVENIGVQKTLIL